VLCNSDGSAARGRVQWRRMILRIVFGRFPTDLDANALVEARDRLGQAALDVPGLESLIVGARRSAVPGDHDIEAAIVSVWTDATLMARATDVAEQDRFLAARLQLPLQVDEAVHYEIVGRTFAALPPDRTAYLRILTIQARPNEEARLVETLRDQQRRFVDLGLVASHLGRRVIGRECEAVTVGVWPDLATIRRATGGRPERPLFEQDLADWLDRIHLETYDGIEIAPRLPAVSGPPIYVIDEQLRIVDITASAAATIGWPAEELVGKSVRDISLMDEHAAAAAWERFLDEGRSSGETSYLVPDSGAVYLRYIAQRDMPIPGRHTILVHRWHEPAPTEEDLAQAVREAFALRDQGGAPDLPGDVETTRPPASPQGAS
jgi:PAS domain-containing protein